jgi:large subunit ribosomal protein L10
VDLRTSLTEADATFTVAKNTLTERAADKAGAERLKPLLEGPTALTFVNGDVAVAAKALATFRRQNNVLEFKGGQLGDEVLSVDQIESIARLPARDVLFGQFVGVVASPITGVVRGLSALISGLAIQLGAIAEQGLVGGTADGGTADGGGQMAEAEPETPAAEPDASETEASVEAGADAPADADTEAPADEPETPEAPAEGDTTETQEG